MVAASPYSQWDPAAPVLVGAAHALVLFAVAFARLRARGRADHAPWSRAALFVLAIAALTVALVSPLDAVGDDYLLSAHMLQHALLLDVVPALVLLALRGPLLVFFPPPAVLRDLGHVRPLRRAVSTLLRPRWSFALWLAVLVLWHVPAVYELALRHAGVHDLEHATFLLVGFLVWFQLLDPLRRGTLSGAGRAGYALALITASHLLLHPALHGSGPLYSTYADQPRRLLGLSPLSDQHWAVVVMTVDQALTLGTLLVVLALPNRREVGRFVRGEPALD